MKILPSHTAILVPSVVNAADKLSKYGFSIGKPADFEGEGTIEIYVEVEKRNSLLLMQPSRPGAYQRALEKRGPGLHHLAIDVLNLEPYLESLVGTGWLIHPKSIETMRELRTAYLARPGFPGLIEVQEKMDLEPGPLFVEGISLKMDASLASLLAPIGLSEIVKPVTSSSALNLNGHLVMLEDLF